MKNIINWIVQHDNKRLFVILYIGLSVVLSIAISLFWLLLIVVVHFVFEIITQSSKRTDIRNVFLESLWETKLDFALVVFALCLAVYLDFIFGIAGLGALGRGGAVVASRTGAIAANTGGKVVQVSTRFAALQRAVRGILLSLDDVANATKSFFATKRNITANNSTDPVSNTIMQDSESGSWQKKWTAMDYTGLILLVSSMALILSAPWITGLSWSEIGMIVLEEFHPYPWS